MDKTVINDTNSQLERHGEWINPRWNGDDFIRDCRDCSLCGETAYHYLFPGVKWFYKYCPSCGAKMDLKPIHKPIEYYMEEDNDI